MKRFISPFYSIGFLLLGSAICLWMKRQCLHLLHSNRIYSLTLKQNWFCYTQAELVLLHPNIIGSLTVPRYEMTLFDILFHWLSAFVLRYLPMDAAPMLESVTLKQNLSCYTQTELILLHSNRIDSVTPKHN